MVGIPNIDEGWLHAEGKRGVRVCRDEYAVIIEVLACWKVTAHLVVIFPTLCVEYPCCCSIYITVVQYRPSVEETLAGEVIKCYASGTYGGLLQSAPPLTQTSGILAKVRFLVLNPLSPFPGCHPSILPTVESPQMLHTLANEPTGVPRMCACVHVCVFRMCVCVCVIPGSR